MHVKIYDGETKWMYFLIEDDDLLENIIYIYIYICMYVCMYVCIYNIWDKGIKSMQILKRI